jgi:bifunctional non-homologous end joining protein LigD
MLLQSAPAPFTKPGWLYELKHDGFRVLAVKQGSTVRLFSRNGRDMAEAFPELVEQMLTLPNVVLDGELVMLDPDGRPQFDRLFSRAFRTRFPRDAAREDPACIFAFDLLALRGRDQRERPLQARKEALKRVLSHTIRVRYAEHLDCGISLFQLAERMRMDRR